MANQWCPTASPLSKIHHAAFDAHLIGIDADYRPHCRALANSAYRSLKPFLTACAVSMRFRPVRRGLRVFCLRLKELLHLHRRRFIALLKCKRRRAYLLILMARGRTITAAVVGSAEVRAAFKHLATSMSAAGTFETCQPARIESACRGKAEVIGAPSKRRD